MFVGVFLKQKHVTFTSTSTRTIFVRESFTEAKISSSFPKIVGVADHGGNRSGRAEFSAVLLDYSSGE